ncbi:MAG: hypothetical protein ACTSYC_04710 [Promethearchaeota archaeon]
MFKLVFSEKALNYIKRHVDKEHSSELDKLVVTLFFYSSST